MLNAIKRANKFLGTRFGFGFRPHKILTVAIFAVITSTPVMGGIVNSLQKDIMESLNNHTRFAEAYGQNNSCVYEADSQDTSSLITNQVIPPLTNPTTSSISTLGSSSQFNLPFNYRVAGKNYNSLYTANYGTKLEVAFDADVNANPQDYFNFENDSGNNPQYYLAEKSDSDYYTANPLPNKGFVQDGPMQYQTLGTTPNREFVMQWKVKAANIKPAAINDAFFIKRAQPTTLEIQSNDLNINLNPLTINIVTPPTKGTAVVSGQKVTFTPNGNSYGADFFEYTLTDSVTGQVSRTARANVDLSFLKAYNNDLTSSTNVKTVDVLANDYVYFNTDPVLVEIVSAPGYGSAVVNPDNTITFDNGGNTSTANIGYKITDKNGESKTANISIGYYGFDSETNEEIAFDFTAWDTDTESQGVILNSDTPKTLNILNRQNFWADPATTEVSFGGSSTFDDDNYHAQIDANNNLTIYSKDKFGYQDGFTEIPLSIKLKPPTPAYGVNNYTKIANFRVGVVNQMKSTHQVVLQENNNHMLLRQVGQKSYSDFTSMAQSYSPDTMSSHIVSPSLPNEISSGDMGSAQGYQEVGADYNIATISYFSPLNCAPTGVADSYSVLNNLTTNLIPTSNDEDFEFHRSSTDSPLKVINIVSPPTNGTVNILSNGTIDYTPNANYSGNDSFEYEFEDTWLGDSSDTAKSSTAVVTLDVQATIANTNPVANNDTATTNEDQSVTIDVLANDTDSEPGTLTICPSSLTNPANGTVSIVANKVLYTPATNFFGSNSFTYKACDSDGGQSNTATANITVTPVNDLPVANNDTATTPKNQSVTIDVLTNDSDLESSTLTICPSSLTNPSNGTVAVVNNKIVYTPTNNFFGTDTFSYRACDTDGGQSNVATVSITVTNPVIPPVNNAPVASNDTATTPKNQSITVDVLNNDTDPDFNPLTICVSSLTSPANGTVAIVNNKVVYTPTNNFFGTNTFSYKACDSANLQSNVATVTIAVTNPVTPANNPPTLASQTIQALPGQTKSFSLLEEVDPDGDLPVSFRLQNVPADLSCALVNKIISCTISAGEIPGMKSFQVVPTDSKGLEGQPATFVINVEELITKTSIIKDKPDDQIYVGTIIGFEVGVTNANSETIENVVTKVELDPKLLTLYKDTIKNGKIQNLTLADKLLESLSPKVFAADELPTFEIINDNTFLIKIAKMDPNQIINFNFQAGSLIKGKTIVRADTQVLDLNVRKSFAAVELPIEIIDVPAITLNPVIDPIINPIVIPTTQLVRSGLKGFDRSTVLNVLTGFLVTSLIVTVRVGKRFKIK